MAMPWRRAKAKAAAIRADETGKMLADLNRLFDACFRIQKEASIAAGRHIPMVVENVRGAQPWVGRARWAFGSFMLWGDVPALMPIPARAQKFNPDGTNHPSGSWFAIADSHNRGTKVGMGSWRHPDDPRHIPGLGFNTHADRNLREGVKAGDAGWRENGPGRQLQDRAIKNNGGSWFNIAHNTTSGKGQNPDGRKQPGIGGMRANGKGDAWFQDGAAQLGSKSPSRKMASAMIAKIPTPLARHIAKTYFPNPHINN
jgi:hypothetical protein